MIRSGKVPAHTSWCHWFQARRQASPSSGSSDLMNTDPQKPATRDGKHREAHTPLRSMSATRASMSKQPGRMSSKRAGSMLQASLGRPITALSPMFG